MDIPSIFKSRRTPKAAGHTPTPPRVDLLPPPMRARHAHRRRQRASIALASATTAVVLGATALLAVSNSAAQSGLDQARGEADQVAAAVAKYAPVTSLAAQTHALTVTVETRGASAIDHAEVIDRFLQAVDGSLQLNSVDVTTGEEAGATCTTTDPFHEVSTVGCISFTGTAVGGHAGASQALRDLGAEEWFIDPFIPSVSSGQDGAPVSGSVALSQAALPEGAVVEGLPAPGDEADTTEKEDQ